MRFLSHIADSFTSNLIDAYWSFVTSPVMLGALIITAIVCRILAAVTIVPEQYRWPFRPLALLLAAFFFVNIGHRLADERAEVKQLRVDLMFAQTELSQQQATATQAKMLADAAQSRASGIENQVTTYGLHYLPQPGAADASKCPGPITDAQFRELRDISRGTMAGTKRASRSLIDRLRKLGTAG
jgi:hypothetical protein